jgi:N-acetyl-gamma-glutamyl-phosphate reductase
MNRVDVGIIGASGYTGEELLRLLLVHPQVHLTAVTSRQYAGRTVAQVFPRFAVYPQARELRFADPNPGAVAKQAQVVFLALPHGVASQFAVPLLEQGRQVIDLSADFRLRDPQIYREFYGHDHPAPGLLPTAVYGLPEIHRDAIRTAKLIASPGCYPTSILLPTLPLVRANLIHPEAIIADSLSGVSGAGRKAEVPYLFVECHESVRPYGVPKHRHLSEIEEQISLAAGLPVAVQFTPHLIPVNRGILTTLYLAPGSKSKTPRETAALADRIAACYREAYADEPFVRLLEEPALPDTKNVVGTNAIEIAWRLDPRTGALVVMSALDNVLKGAGGQAVQSFNILRGFPETAGLI